MKTDFFFYMGFDLTVYELLHSLVSKEVATFIFIILYYFFGWTSIDAGTHGKKQDKQ